MDILRNGSTDYNPPISLLERQDGFLKYFRQLCITLQRKLEWLLALVSPPSLAWPPKKQAWHLTDPEAAAVLFPPPPRPTVAKGKTELLLAVISPPSLTWPPKKQKQAWHLTDPKAAAALFPPPPRPTVAKGKIDLLLAVISPPSSAWPPKKQKQAWHLTDPEAAAALFPPPPRPTVAKDKIELLPAVVSPPSLAWPPKKQRNSIKHTVELPELTLAVGLTCLAVPALIVDCSRTYQGIRHDAYNVIYT